MMGLRQIFTHDLVQDSNLLAVFCYCLSDAQPKPILPLFKGEVIGLNPYEVFIQFDRMTSDLNISKEVFMSKIATLEKMRRLTVRTDADYCRVTLNVRFPIGASEERREPNEQCIPVSLEQWVKIDLEKISINRFSKRYQDMVRQVLHRFQSVVGKKPLMEIGVSDYREYVRVLTRGGASSASVNNYRRVLVASLNRARVDNFIKNNVVESEKPLPSSRNRPRIVEREELELLMSTIDVSFVKDVIMFALLSAKRHGEILNLAWSDIDYDNKNIKIHSSESYRVKFNKEQNLPLSDPLRALLAEIKKKQLDACIESDHIFVEEGGRPLRMKMVQQTVKAAREVAGLGDHVTLHALRRTSATRMKQNGATTNTIKGLLNHSDEKTTNLYLGVPREDEVDALNSLSFPSFLPSDFEMDDREVAPPNQFLTPRGLRREAIGKNRLQFERKGEQIAEEVT